MVLGKQGREQPDLETYEEGGHEGQEKAREPKNWTTHCVND